jgi:hypothetical protein
MKGIPFHGHYFLTPSPKGMDACMDITIGVFACSVQFCDKLRDPPPKKNEEKVVKHQTPLLYPNYFSIAHAAIYKILLSFHMFLIWESIESCACGA